MPVNGVPSDEWRVRQAMGDHYERMDDDQAKRCHQKSQGKKLKTKDASIRECKDLNFKMPF